MSMCQILAEVLEKNYDLIIFLTEYYAKQRDGSTQKQLKNVLMLTTIILLINKMAVKVDKYNLVKDTQDLKVNTEDLREDDPKPENI